MDRNLNPQAGAKEKFREYGFQYVAGNAEIVKPAAWKKIDETMEKILEKTLGPKQKYISR